MSTEAVIEVLGIVFMAGIFYGEIRAMRESIRKDIARLEEKQDKYNNLQERTHKLEIWSALHQKEHDK